MLPSELLLHIFGYLSFPERIQCTGVCKSWRELLLNWSGMWETVSHEDLDDLVITLLPYRRFMKPSSVRTLIIYKPWPGQEDTTDLDFLSFCTQIERVFVDSCLWTEAWLQKLFLLTQTSLTCLDLRCGDEAAAEKVLRPDAILGFFKNLQHLSLVCPIYYGAVEPRTQLMEDEDAPCWLAGPHGLTSLVINLYGRRFKWDLPIERLLKHLPHLKRVRLHPADYTSMGVVSQALIRHCPDLITIQLLAEPRDQEDGLFEARNQHSLSVSDEASVPSIVRPILAIHSPFLTHLHLYTSIDFIWVLLKGLVLPQLLTLRLDGIFAVGSRRPIPTHHETSVLVQFLRRHPTLTSFAALHCDCITDEVIAALQPGSLVALELECARLSEDGLLAILDQMPRLRRLCLDNMACVTDPVLAQIDHMPHINHLSLYDDNNIGFAETLFRFLDHHAPRYRVCRIRCGSDAAPPPADIIRPKLKRLANQWHFIYEHIPHAEFLFLDYDIEPRYISTA